MHRSTLSRKAARAIAAVAVMIASISFATVRPAAAAGATSCPSDGHISRGDRCTSLDNGVLSVRTISVGNYVTVNYERSWSVSASCSVVYGKPLTSGGTIVVTRSAGACGRSSAYGWSPTGQSGWRVETREISLNSLVAPDTPHRV